MSDPDIDIEPSAWWRRPFEDIALALTLLTRIPMPGFAIPEDAPLSRAVWAFPFAGALIGAIGAAGYEAAIFLNLNVATAVIIALCAMTLASGALHEDGLADFWDGIGGGNDQQTRLDIMRDSRIGTYGSLALLFCFAFQLLMLISLAWKSSIPMWCVLVSVATISRAAMALPLAILPSARNTGLGATIANTPKGGLALATILTIVLTTGLLGFLPATYSIAGAFAMSTVVTLLAHRYLGGQTGDVLGATASMAFVGALLGLNIIGGHP